jgi:hypothetical protein
MILLQCVFNGDLVVIVIFEESRWKGTAEEV